MVLLAGLLAGVAAAVAGLAVASPRAQALATGVVFTTICTCAVVYHGFRNGRRDLFSPPVLMLSYMALGIGVKGLADLLTSASKISAVADPSSADFADLLTSVFLHSLLAVLALLAGYHLARPRRAGAPLTPAPPLEPQPVRVVLAAGAAIMAMAVAYFISRLGTAIIYDPGFVAVEGTYGLFWLYPLMFLALYTWVLPIVNDWSVGRPARAWQIAGLCLTALLIYTLTSSKSALVNAALLLVVCRHYAVRPVPIRTLLFLAVAFLIALPVLYLHRAIGLSTELLRHLDWKTLTAGAQIFLGRSYLADSFGAVLLYTPRVYPYQYGAPWLELLYFWVPRAWWPTKPLTFSIGFGSTYFSSFEQGKLSFISPTLPGDAYLNFGTIGVFGVFLVLGFALRWWYERMVGSRPRPETVLLYAATVYWIALGAEQTIAVDGGLVLSYLSPVVLMVMLARGRFPRSGPTAAPAG